MFHTGLHDEYHRPSDTAKLINSPGMTQVTRLLFGVVYDLAERPAAPGIPSGGPPRNAGEREGPPRPDREAGRPAGRRLDRRRGGDGRGSGVGGEAGSPADRAGLRVGDCIVRFAGRPIRSDDDFFAAVCAAESPASLTVKRPGEEKPLDLTADLSGSPLRWGIVWRVDDAEPGVVILTHVVPGSPAARAGLAAGDRIYQVGGRDFADEAGFAQLAKTLSLPIQVLVERDGRLRIVVLQFRQAEPSRRAA